MKIIYIEAFVFTKLMTLSGSGGGGGEGGNALTSAQRYVLD